MMAMAIHFEIVHKYCVIQNESSNIYDEGEVIGIFVHIWQNWDP